MKRLGHPNVPDSSNGWCCGSVLRYPEEMSETDIVLLSSLVPNAWQKQETGETSMFAVKSYIIRYQPPMFINFSIIHNKWWNRWQHFRL